MIQYIDKSALVAEIEIRRESNAKERYFGRLVEDNYFLDFLDTLEVKEVDLKKESLTWKDIGTIDQLLWDLSGEHSGKSDNEGYYKAVLSRFKAQKGEEV